MATVAIFAALFAVLAMPVEAEAENARYIALPYVVRVAEGVVGMSGINPRYQWLDDRRLVVPVRSVVEAHDIGPDLQKIDLFVIDLINGTSVRIASYDEVFGITLVRSKDGAYLFLAVIVDIRPPEEGEFMNQRIRERYAVDTSSYEIFPTTLETIQEQRAANLPGSPRPYPEALLRIDTNDLYSNTRRSSSSYFYWARWNNYILALGERDGMDYTDPHDVRLYNEDGSTAYLFPQIRVYNDHVLGFPEVFQLSLQDRFLLLNENIATRSARDVLRLRNIRSVIYVYGFEDEDPSEDYDTVVYVMDTEDFGAGYEIGEVFAVEREIVDGSAMSGGPVSIPIDYDEEVTEAGSQEREAADQPKSAQAGTELSIDDREAEVASQTEEPAIEQRATVGLAVRGVAVLGVVIGVVAIIRRRR